MLNFTVAVAIHHQNHTTHKNENGHKWQKKTLYLPMYTHIFLPYCEIKGG